jgi:uncharacterized membrane protein
MEKKLLILSRIGLVIVSVLMIMFVFQIIGYCITKGTFDFENITAFIGSIGSIAAFIGLIYLSITDLKKLN